MGSRPNLGQVSLDVSSIENSLAFYRDQIGLNLLSHQPVPDRSFSLWFLGQEDLQPPSDAVEAIENREWLWALPETTLELRAFDNPQPLRRPHPPLSELGFRGIGFSRAGAVPNRLQDPDGVELWLS